MVKILTKQVEIWYFHRVYKSDKFVTITCYDKISINKEEKLWQVQNVKMRLQIVCMES